LLARPYGSDMKKQVLIGIAILALAAAASAATLHETFDRTFEVRPGSNFTLENTNGHITVRSWDQPRVRIVGEKRVESRDADAAKKAFAELRVEPAQTSTGLHVTTHYPKRGSDGLFDWLAGTNVSMNVNYEVTVPRSMNIDLDNTNGGIDVSEVRGSMHISNTNGHIELVRCAGDVDAETTNGHVVAELTEVNAKGVRLETTNGRVTIALPRSISARVDAATTNGRINTDLPITTTRFEKTSLRGTINGGGAADVKLRSTNGSIDIQAK
jgi:DUF4097 and DUF4098 domain-containing protein YvlB